MPLKYDDAYAATDPSLSEEERKASANRLIEGVRANEIYWDSRPELEALRAQAEGHGVVTRGEDSPTVSATPTDTVEGTAVEEPTGIGSGSDPAAAAAAPSGGEPVATPDNPTETVAALRKQLTDAGIPPEA